jgi:hypothetical protein
MIKSSDGSSSWGQFNPALVASLHQSGLKVCAWQYVYGIYPDAEAAVGAAAVNDGADCLVIDAEGEYAGKYVQAQRYVTQLRRRIGSRFPVGLAGLPYVDYHPAFPYSVFLGPGGAQYNLPQVYWYDIGTTVDAAYAHTYRFNALYQRPIYPLGQLTGPPPAADIVRFRQLSIAYGARGLSWWLWQDATPSEFTTLSRPIGTPAGFAPPTAVASLGRGARGDLVVWAQQHLVTAGQRMVVDGALGPATQRGVRRFQTVNALTVSGVIDAPTWLVLLRYQPAFVHWWLHVPKPKPKPTKTKTKTTSKRGRRAADTPPPAIDATVPASASMRAVRNEFAGRRGRRSGA